MVKRRFKVFISYARSDQAKAHDLYKRLTSDGFDTWIDKESILPGQDWELEIRKFIRKTDVVIVCLSKKFNNAGFRQKEVRLALDAAMEKPEGEIFIIPVRLEKCDNLESLRKWNWVDLFEDGGYENLLRALYQHAREINISVPKYSLSKNLETVQIILDGRFSEFDESKRDDLVGVLAALLRLDKSSIRVLRTYPGSIIIELELTKIEANRLLAYFKKGDFRLKKLGILSVKILGVEQKTKRKRSYSKGIPRVQSDEASKSIIGGNQSIVVGGNIIGSNVIIGNGNKINTSGESAIASESNKNVSKSERLVSERVLKDWLKLHDLAENPFGNFDLRNSPHYPTGAAWPNRWEAFFDPISSFALCPALEDAQALSYLLRKECLSLNKETEENGIKRKFFPLMVSSLHISQQQAPLLALASSAAQTWVDFLPNTNNTRKFLELTQAKQDAVLELLYWKFESARSIISLLQSNGLQEDADGLSLILKIEKSAKELSASPARQDSTLLSWLKLRPLFCMLTYLILTLDALPIASRSSWFEQLNILIPELSVETDGIVVKAISSTDFSEQLPLPVTPLDWSVSQLKLSLNSQFDAAMKKTEQEMGKVTDFRSLFGSDPTVGYFETEANTTDRLTSASRHSLARMLSLGNSLFQYHCEHRIKDGVPEKYLYTEDLETILKTT